MSTCYSKTSAGIVFKSSFAPCPSSQSPGGHLSCCYKNGRCVGDNLCYYGDDDTGAGKGGFYARGCTDASWEDEGACFKACENSASAGVVYDSNTKMWSCHPQGPTFDNPSPEVLLAGAAGELPGTSTSASSSQPTQSSQEPSSTDSAGSTSEISSSTTSAEQSESTSAQSSAKQTTLPVSSVTSSRSSAPSSSSSLSPSPSLAIPASSSSSSSTTPLKSGTIAGIVIGSLISLALLIALIFWLIKLQRKKRNARHIQLSDQIDLGQEPRKAQHDEVGYFHRFKAELQARPSMGWEVPKRYELDGGSSCR